MSKFADDEIHRKIAYCAFVNVNKTVVEYQNQPFMLWLGQYSNNFSFWFGSSFHLKISFNKNIRKLYKRDKPIAKAKRTYNHIQSIHIQVYTWRSVCLCVVVDLILTELSKLVHTRIKMKTNRLLCIKRFI